MNWFLTIFLLIGHLISIFALVHCLLNTKYPQAALGWSAAIILLPYFGTFSYFLFGINRVDSRAAKLMRKIANHRNSQLLKINEIVKTTPCNYAFNEDEHGIVQVGAKKTPMPRQGGNEITPLYNGDQAYPVMLDAIKQAKNEVFLCTYIFEGEKVGTDFVEALVHAHKRGVDVRVIVDGLACGSKFNKFKELLTSSGVLVEKFIPLELLKLKISVNLRNHRKLLICDNIAFTGGMNISDGNLLNDMPKDPIQDIHFKCLGSIILSLREAFLLDWIFLTNDKMTGIPMSCASVGNMDARLIMDGPGSTDEPIQNLICGVISTAQKRVTIFTPYFLPTRELVIALGSAAARGIKVSVVLPEKLDHPFVECAAEHMLPPILQSGVFVYRQPKPFAHTKIILIDDMYTFLGSTNLDPRSLSLNFELNMEVFSYQLNAELTEYADDIIAKSKMVQKSDYNFTDKKDLCTLVKRLKNAAAWVISPYL